MLAVCLAVALLDLPPLAGSLRHVLFDSYQQLLPRDRQFDGVVVVTVDEAALKSHGQWPWPRALMAKLLGTIARAGPVATGVDIIFAEPEAAPRRGDAALVRVLESERIVLGIAGIGEPDPRIPLPPSAAPVRAQGARALPLLQFNGHLQSLEAIDRAAAGRGMLNADARDPIIHKLPLIARIQKVHVPALAIELLRIAQGALTLGIEDGGGEDVTLRVGAVDVPIQSDGSFWLYYGHRRADRLVSADEVLAGRAAERLKDRFVLVGVTGLGLLEWKLSSLGEPIPGVEIHAQLLEQILEGQFLRRAAAARWIELALLALSGVIFVVYVPRLRAWLAMLLPITVLAILAATGLLAFRSGQLLDVATPAVGGIVVFVAVLAATLADAERQRKILREAQTRFEAEMVVARRIQSGLLPVPRILFINETRFSLDAWLEPARSVGGDFYDCFMVDERRLFFVVADVSGKGLPASLFMALSKSLLKSIALRTGDDPGGVLIRANTEIARDNSENLFVTAFAGLLDVETGAFTYCNAGHEPPILHRADGTLVRLEHDGGPPLCVMDDFEYPTAHHMLKASEWLCVVTDGVTEAMNARDELFGFDRLQAMLARQPETSSPAALVAAVRDAVRHFAGATQQSDDITVLCIRWIGISGPTAAAEGSGA